MAQTGRTAAPTGPLLCVSPLVPGKGLDGVVTGFGMLADDWPDLRLEVVGGGPLEPELRAHAAELGLEDRIDFRGPLAPRQVRAALRRCAVLVLSCEPASGPERDLPALVLEAMATGVPVVTTDLAGLPHLVRHDSTGLVVAPDHPAGLAAAVASLLADPARAARLGAAGRRLVAHRSRRLQRLDRLRRREEEVDRGCGRIP